MLQVVSGMKRSLRDRRMCCISDVAGCFTIDPPRPNPICEIMYMPVDVGLIHVLALSVYRDHHDQH